MMYYVLVLAPQAAVEYGDTSVLLQVGVVGEVCSSHVAVLLGFLLLLIGDLDVTADAYPLVHVVYLSSLRRALV